MTVQELEPDLNREGRWLATLEDGRKLKVGEQEVLDYSLYAGCELTEEQIGEMEEMAGRSRRRERAIDLLSRKPMSEKELSDRMLRWGAGEEEIQAVCQRMEQLGYLDDSAYAGRIVRHYASKGYGERRIRDELYRRGVPRELWDQALEELPDPEDTVETYISAHLKGKSGDPKEFKRVSDALVRRGFSWSTVSEAMNRFRREEKLNGEEENI